MVRPKKVIKFFKISDKDEILTAVKKANISYWKYYKKKSINECMANRVTYKTVEGSQYAD